MTERTVTADLLIKAMCLELHMTEEQLFVYLAIEHYRQWLSIGGRARVAQRARVYHERGHFIVRVNG